MLNQNHIIKKIQLLNNNIVDIKDCFDYNQKVEYFSGDNAMYCDKCKKQIDASIQELLYFLIQILIIIINRGDGKEFKVKVEFNEILDLSAYAKIGGTYELISVITHLGESRFRGHFIVTCKSPIDKRWYRYNNDLVNEVNDFKSEILGDPYILFYKKQ